MYHRTLIHIYSTCNSEQVALSCGTVINTYITKTWRPEYHRNMSAI